jgi:AcrR family transcriptional regulator
MSTRKTKEVRRDEVLEAALEEFAELGLHGASTEDIARRAGISQPYVFRLFATKKELFAAVAARCFRETLEMFQRAAEGKRGREALDAIGGTYADRLWSNPISLQVQMQAYAACGDSDIRRCTERRRRSLRLPRTGRRARGRGDGALLRGRDDAEPDRRDASRARRRAVG